MKAYYVKAPMHFELRDEPVSPLQPDEALVEVKACGVCGWDVLVSQVVAKDWMPVGHEFAGCVAAVGSAVRGFSVGDSVVAENSTYCGICEQCKRGNVVHCTNLDHYRAAGAFASVVKVRYTGLYPMTDTYRAAALAEPLTVAIDMVEAAEIPLSGSVAVFGPGPIGLMICRLALLKGAARVYLTGHSHSTARWNAARQIGVTDCIYVDKQDVVSFIKNREPKGVDRVLITAPPATVADAVQITRFGGIICYNGIKFDDNKNIVLDGNQFHFNRLQLRGVHSIPNLGWPQALDLLQRRVIDPDLFITQVFPFSKVPEAIQLAATNRTDTIKVMVDGETT